MTNVVGNANEFLKLAYQVIGKDSKQEVGVLKTKGWRHWSFYLTVAGSVVSVVCAVNVCVTARMR